MMRLLVGMALILGLIYTLATALTQVQPGERAVVRRFGRVMPEKPGPGLYVGLPWGFDRVDRIPITEVRRISAGSTDADDELLTGDHNLVNIRVEIQYRVREEDVEKFVLQADSVDALVSRSTESSLAEWIAARTVDDVLLQGKELLPMHLRRDVQQRLDGYNSGVEIEQASITQLVPPNDVKPAFDKLAQAQTNIRTQINQAEQHSVSRRREAEAENYRLLSQARAYAQEQLLQARAEAKNFTLRFEQYQALTKKNPDYLNVLWLDEMTRLYTRMQAAGRIDILDHYLSSEGLTITQFPLQPKKK